MISQSLIQIIRSLKLAVFDFDGVLTNNQVLVSETGEESVLCSRSDGLGLRLLSAVGVSALILSTEKNPVVQARAKKLKLECISGCDDKGTALRGLSAERGIPLEQIAFVGNDANDLEALEIVGFSVAVGDAYPEAKSAALHCLSRSGGLGAVREFCELICRIKMDLPEEQSPWRIPAVEATYRKRTQS